MVNKKLFKRLYVSKYQNFYDILNVNKTCYCEVNMVKVNNAFWAKKKEIDGAYYWLPLSQHLEDTKNIIGLLWDHWLSQGQRDLIKSSFSYQREGLGRNVVEFLGATHDIGKASPVFQSTRNKFINSEGLDDLLLGKLETAGFTGMSTLFLAFPEKTRHDIAGQCILYRNGLQKDLASIIGGHHGKPANNDSTFENHIAYEKNYYQSEKKDSTIYQKWFEEQNNILNWALLECDFQNVDELPEIKQPAQVVLSGLLIMADWIASNENYFPLIPIEEYSVENNDMRYQEAFLKWKGDSALWNSMCYIGAEEIYKKRFGFNPNSFQRKVFETIEKSNSPQMLIIEAPMGVGKTEAALVSTEQLAYRLGMGGMFFGLPTQATSNGIFPRIVDWLNKIEIDSDEKVSLRLSHGKAALNEVFQSLANGVDIEEKDGNISVNQWFSGRKTTSLDDFVVGTIDNFLMTALKQKHLALRHLGFSKKVVIIDEVHAYDSYMNQYLLRAIEWMGAYGVPLIMLSATLPAERREEMIRAYLKGKGIKYRDAIKPESGIGSDAYPLITYIDGDEIKQEINFEKSKEKNIKVVRLEDEALWGVIDDVFESKAILGIIVNTVKRAQKLAGELANKYGEDQVFLLHSNYIASHRAEKEDKLMQMIGKGSNRPEGKIVIGTQVIEQSLDIDFDVLVSDLAPMDLLLQRIGRLHRHEIQRPDKFKEAYLYVLGTNEELEFEEGSSFVYGDYLLARSQYFLTEEIILPSDISKLVQKVYGNEELILTDEIQDKYLRMKDEHEVLLENKNLKAKVFRLDSPTLKSTRRKANSLIGWLENTNPNDSEEHAYAQVRDSQDTIEVIALKKIGQGYGLFDSNIDLSDKLTEAGVARKISQNTIRLPQVLSASYNIDQTIKELEEYNIEYLKDWQDLHWLKGSLGLIFDEDNSAVLNGFKLRYDIQYGLSYERV